MLALTGSSWYFGSWETGLNSLAAVLCSLLCLCFGDEWTELPREVFLSSSNWTLTEYVREPGSWCWGGVMWESSEAGEVLPGKFLASCEEIKSGHVTTFLISPSWMQAESTDGVGENRALFRETQPLRALSSSGGTLLLNSVKLQLLSSSSVLLQSGLQSTVSNHKH